MPGLVGPRASGTSAEDADADARLARALNERRARGLHPGDQANLAALIMEHFGQKKCEEDGASIMQQ